MDWIVGSVSHNGFRILADKSVPKDLDAAGVVTRCYQDDAIASIPGEFPSDRAHFVRSDVIPDHLDVGRKRVQGAGHLTRGILMFVGLDG